MAQHVSARGGVKRLLPCAPQPRGWRRRLARTARTGALRAAPALREEVARASQRGGQRSREQRKVARRWRARQTGWRDARRQVLAVTGPLGHSRAGAMLTEARRAGSAAGGSARKRAEATRVCLARGSAQMKPSLRGHVPSLSCSENMTNDAHAAAPGGSAAQEQASDKKHNPAQQHGSAQNASNEAPNTLSTPRAARAQPAAARLRARAPCSGSAAMSAMEPLVAGTALRAARAPRRAQAAACGAGRTRCWTGARNATATSS